MENLHVQDEYNQTRYNNGIALNSTDSSKDWASASTGTYTVISNFDILRFHKALPISQCQKLDTVVVQSYSI